MSIKPSKRIAAGAAGLAIAAAITVPGIAAAQECSLISGDGQLCLTTVTQDEEEETTGLFGSIPLIGPILDGLFSGFGS